MLSTIIVAQQKNDNLLGDLSKGKQQTDFAVRDYHIVVNNIHSNRSIFSLCQLVLEWFRVRILQKD